MHNDCMHMLLCMSFVSICEGVEMREQVHCAVREILLPSFHTILNPEQLKSRAKN